ncbi:hypothetical protein U1Q18_014068, partial [Sarracenia purpurea var. burkii]
CLPSHFRIVQQHDLLPAQCPHGLPLAQGRAITVPPYFCLGGAVPVWAGPKSPLTNLKEIRTDASPKHSSLSLSSVAHFLPSVTGSPQPTTVYGGYTTLVDMI